MLNWAEGVLIFLVLTDLVMLGSSRIALLIRMIAVQGAALGLLPLLLHPGTPMLRQWLLAIATIGLKGIVFPRLLGRAQRDANVRREVEPFVGYTLSLILGLGGLAFSFWLGGRLTPVGPASGAAGTEAGATLSPLVIPFGLFGLLVGLFIIITRRKALTQVLGYLAMENGIYAMGVALASDVPFLIELGVLLDVFVAVFVMGIIIFHISREFDHIDTDRLSSLADLTRDSGRAHPPTPPRQSLSGATSESSASSKELAEGKAC
ncbi:MAG TPA: NADH-quinone oxidoreductase subunit K [Planctomycetota bacterium]